MSALLPHECTPVYPPAFIVFRVVWNGGDLLGWRPSDPWGRLDRQAGRVLVTDVPRACWASRRHMTRHHCKLCGQALQGRRWCRCRTRVSTECEA